MNEKMLLAASTIFSIPPIGSFVSNYVRFFQLHHAPHAAAQILATAALVQRAAVLALHEAAARRRLLVQQRVQEAKILRAVLFHTAI